MLPKKTPTITLTKITTPVNLTISSVEGHTTFCSSSLVSFKKLTGVVAIEIKSQYFRDLSTF